MFFARKMPLMNSPMKLLARLQMMAMWTSSAVGSYPLSTVVTVEPERSAVLLKHNLSLEASKGLRS